MPATTASSGPSVPAPVRGVERVVALVVGVVLALGGSVGVVLGSGAGPARADDVSAPLSAGGWTWPLSPAPPVVRGFEAPAGPYAAGHRGVDLGGRAGQSVVAVAAGRVRHVGVVAGVAVVSVDHGGEVSTYQPVHGTVRVGQQVAAGQPLGRLLVAGSHCVPRVCLHLGRRIERTYADPLALLQRAASVRLFTPTGPLPLSPVDVSPVGSGVLGRPAPGPVTSPFGPRVHPITGVHKLHDGLDVGAPCGTPVRAAADGEVVATGFHPAYGNRVVVRHSGGLVTSYNHLSRSAVAAGTAVRRGQLVGNVGSTGLSTGCHLHFMVVAGGAPVDPARYL